jgi:drug/metabolite transporter (DMT)-like permease
MPHVGPGLGTILTSAELPIAVILSALVLTEQVSMSQWLGVVFILGGIIAGNLKISKTIKKSSYLERESTF